MPVIAVLIVALAAGFIATQVIHSRASAVVLASIIGALAVLALALMQAG